MFKLTQSAIPGNVSQGSVLWIVPRDITQGSSDQLFSIQLWDVESGFGCSSPSFEFAQIDESEEYVTTNLPFGPFVTTAISILDTGYVTATATMGTYRSDEPQFFQAMTGSITATDGTATSEATTSATFDSATSTTSISAASSSSTSTSDNDDKSSGPNTIAIAVGTVGGFLVVALIVLSVLLWRARRKRANNKADTETLPGPKEISPSLGADSPMSQADTLPVTTAEVSGDTGRHEMIGSTTRAQELPSRNMDPVELPADEIPPPAYPHGEIEVSPVTGHSRSSSLSFDKGTFTVSPLRDRRDRKE